MSEVHDKDLAPQSAGATAGHGADLDLSDPALYTNRELSWLDFDMRVMQLAEDASVPLLERAKFLAITATNLDEFVMVRLAGLHEQLDAGIDARGPDGLSPADGRSAGIHVAKISSYYPSRYLGWSNPQ